MCIRSTNVLCQRVSICVELCFLQVTQLIDPAEVVRNRTEANYFSFISVAVSRSLGCERANLFARDLPQLPYRHHIGFPSLIGMKVAKRFTKCLSVCFAPAMLALYEFNTPHKLHPYYCTVRWFWRVLPLVRRAEKAAVSRGGSNLEHRAADAVYAVH